MVQFASYLSRVLFFRASISRKTASAPGWRSGCYRQIVLKKVMHIVLEQNATRATLSHQVNTTTHNTADLCILHLIVTLANLCLLEHPQMPLSVFFVRLQLPSSPPFEENTMYLYMTWIVNIIFFGRCVGTVNYFATYFTAWNVLL